MYFGAHRAVAEQTFQQTINPETGVRDPPGEADILIGKDREMGTGLILTRATAIILCEPTFNSSLFYQMPKRAYRYRGKKDVVFYVLSAGLLEMSGLVRMLRISHFSLCDFYSYQRLWSKYLFLPQHFTLNLFQPYRRIRSIPLRLRSQMSGGVTDQNYKRSY